MTSVSPFAKPAAVAGESFRAARTRNVVKSAPSASQNAPNVVRGRNDRALPAVA
jgi:hypothetical protein